MSAGRYVPRLLRAAGAAARDERFARSSPIPLLPDDVQRALRSRHEIALPPPGLLGPGNQSLDGLVFLVSLARAVEARDVFEIGTYNGATAWTLARNVAGARVHTLDLPPEEAPALALGETDASNRLHFERRVFEALPPEGAEVTQHWGDSATFDFSPWRDGVDLVYVDGAHSEPYVRSDTAHAFELVRGGGAIVWDDYWRRISGVRAVLDEQAERLFRVPGTRLVVHLTAGALERVRS